MSLPLRKMSMHLKKRRVPYFLQLGGVDAPPSAYEIDSATAR
jgi:hypothetical protein